MKFIIIVLLLFSFPATALVSTATKNTSKKSETDKRLQLSPSPGTCKLEDVMPMKTFN